MSTDDYPEEWLKPSEKPAVEERKDDFLDRLRAARPGATPRDYKPEPDYPAHWINRKATS